MSRGLLWNIFIFNICLCLVLFVFCCFALSHHSSPQQLQQQDLSSTDLSCLWPSTQAQSGFFQFKKPKDYLICVTALLCRSADFISTSFHGDKWKLARLSTGWATDVGYVTTKSSVLHIFSFGGCHSNMDLDREEPLHFQWYYHLRTSV